jgi:molybdopterin molybdotransferase
MTTSNPIEIDEARRMVLEASKPLPSEQVELDEAFGRVLAEEVIATEPVPAFDGSAMDGFAVRSEDVAGATPISPVTLGVVGESRAGAPSHVRVNRGEAISISTGAMLPNGADCVVRIEDTRAQAEEAVEILAAADRGRDVRRAGEDIRIAQRVLSRGLTLRAAELGVLGSLGRARVACTKRPRVSVLVSGDELLVPGQPARPGGVRDSNSHSISALARDAGAEVQRVGVTRDDPEATRDALASALREVDVAVICGGVSVGRHDHVRPSLQALGVREAFWGIALKPGRPAWFGTLGPTLVFGLPGNPVSAMVTFMLLVVPALRVMLGASSANPRATAMLASDYEKPAGQAHALRCRLHLQADGLQAEPTGPQGSHILTSMLDADALAIIPAATTRMAAGERVEVELLRAVGQTR